MPHHPYDLVIIGGGIIGLATALETSARFPNKRLLVVEKEERVATHQTGHNSGVIHSGLYYRPGSIKARTCVEGRAALLEFCREEGLPYRLCGKVVVAMTREEIPALEELLRRGRQNGVGDLAIVGPERLREIEPHAAGVAALHVPHAGVVDYNTVARRYAEIVSSRGGEIRTGVRAVRIAARDFLTVVETTAGEFTARRMVNCAGLFSDRIARLAGAPVDLRIIPFRGEYYDLAPERRHLVRGLIYPLPDPRFPFLGVHLTARIDGSVEAGPNAVLALKREGYSKRDVNVVDMIGTLTFRGFHRLVLRHWRSGLSEFHRSFSRRAFLRALQRLVPDLRDTDLKTGGSGVRAQAVDRDGTIVDDFRFAHRGRVVHVLNVPSPAATASLTIARRIVDLLAETA